MWHIATDKGAYSCLDNIILIKWFLAQAHTIFATNFFLNFRIKNWDAYYIRVNTVNMLKIELNNSVTMQIRTYDEKIKKSRLYLSHSSLADTPSKYITGGISNLLKRTI